MLELQCSTHQPESLQHRLHAFRGLCESELKSSDGEQNLHERNEVDFPVGRQLSNFYLSECHDEELRDLPQEMNRFWRRTFDYHLHDHRDQKRYAGQYSAQAHFLQRPTDADAFEQRVDGVFEERNADENEQRVDHLKLISFELIGSNLAVHGLALQDPSGALLIVERPEERKWDEQIQNVEQDLALVDELLAVLCNRVIEPVIAGYHATFSSSRGDCILAEKRFNYSYTSGLQISRKLTPTHFATLTTMFPCGGTIRYNG